MLQVNEARLLLILNAAEGRMQLLLAQEEHAPAAEGHTPTDCRLLCAQDWHAPSQGAELLAPALANALERLGMQPGNIRRIACVRGPGGFTGLRLVLASAAGLARAVGALQGGVDYLPLLAANAAHALSPLMGDNSRLFWVITHARRQLVHMQGFFCTSNAQDVPRPCTEILVCPPHEAVALITEQAQGDMPPPLLLGSGLWRNEPDFAAAFAGTSAARAPVWLGPGYNHPTPGALLACAAAAPFADTDVAPLYVRPSDAEENLAHIARTLRLDPEAAQTKARELTGGR